MTTASKAVLVPVSETGDEMVESGAGVVTTIFGVDDPRTHQVDGEPNFRTSTVVTAPPSRLEMFTSPDWLSPD